VLTVFSPGRRVFKTFARIVFIYSIIGDMLRSAEIAALPVTCVGPAKGSKHCYFAETKSFFGDFRKNLMTSCKYEFYDSDDVRAFMLENWFKQDFWKVPRHMKAFFADSNEGPVPWTVAMRRFIEEHKISSYEQMQRKFEKREADKDMWEVLKADALKTQSDAVDAEKPLYTANAGYVGPARADLGPIPRANPPIGVDASKKSRKPDPPADDGAGASKPKRSKKPDPPAGAGADASKPRKSKKPDPPADDGAGAAAPVAADDRLQYGRSSLMEVPAVEIEKFLGKNELLAILDTELQLRGYVLCPLDNDEACRAAVDLGHLAVSFQQFAKRKSCTHQVFDMFVDQVDTGIFETMMPGCMVPILTEGSIGDDVLDEFEVTKTSIEKFAMARAEFYRIKDQFAHSPLHATIIRKIERVIGDFTDPGILADESTFRRDLTKKMEDIHKMKRSFESFKTAAQKIQRQALCKGLLCSQFEEKDLDALLQAELKDYLYYGGIDKRTKRPIAPEEFKATLDFYAATIPAFTHADKDKYLGMRDTLIESIEYLTTPTVENLEILQKYEDTLGDKSPQDDFIAKNVGGLWDCYDARYKIYTGPTKARAAAYVRCIEPEILLPSEELMITQFIAKSAVEEYSEFSLKEYETEAYEFVQTSVLKNTDSTITEITRGNFFQLCNFTSAIAVEEIKSALANCTYMPDIEQKADCMLSGIGYHITANLKVKRSYKEVRSSKNKKQARFSDSSSSAPGSPPAGGQARSPSPPAGGQARSPSPPAGGSARSPSPPKASRSGSRPGSRAGSRAPSMDREKSYFDIEMDHWVSRKRRASSEQPRTLYNPSTGGENAANGGKKARSGKDRA